MTNAAKIMDVINYSLGATVPGIAHSTGLEETRVNSLLNALHAAGLIRVKIRRTMGGNIGVFHPSSSYANIDAVAAKEVA